MTDFSYEAGRNRLIPLAEQHANRECGKLPEGNRLKWAKLWNLAFLDEMDRLAEEVELLGAIRTKQDGSGWVKSCGSMVV